MDLNENVRFPDLMFRGMCTRLCPSAAFLANIRNLSMVMIAFLLFLGSTSSYAQSSGAGSYPFKGRVPDKKTGQAVSGASILIKGSSSGVTTGEDGRFSINIPSGSAVPVVSSVGYGSRELKPKPNSEAVVISLEPQDQGLNEVVVTALDIQRTAKFLTYATQRLSGDQLNEVGDANIANTLCGKVAGLTINSSANGPGGAARVVLRGNRSIQGSNNALIVADGVAIDNSTPSGQIRDDAGKSISEIAYQLGFKYPQHFTRFFKQKNGMLPLEYRRMD